MHAGDKNKHSNILPFRLDQFLALERFYIFSQKQFSAHKRGIVFFDISK